MTNGHHWAARETVNTIEISIRKNGLERYVTSPPLTSNQEKYITEDCEQKYRHHQNTANQLVPIDGLWPGPFLDLTE